MLATQVCTVSLILTSVSHHHANTTPPATSDLTNHVATSPMLVQQALTACVFLDTTVTRTALFLLSLLLGQLASLSICPSVYKFFPVSTKFGLSIEVDEWYKTVWSKIKVKVIEGWKLRKWPILKSISSANMHIINKLLLFSLLNLSFLVWILMDVINADLRQQF